MREWVPDASGTERCGEDRELQDRISGLLDCGQVWSTHTHTHTTNGENEFPLLVFLDMCGSRGVTILRRVWEHTRGESTMRRPQLVGSGD